MWDFIAFSSTVISTKYRYSFLLTAYPHGSLYLKYFSLWAWYSYLIFYNLSFVCMQQGVMGEDEVIHFCLLQFN